MIHLADKTVSHRVGQAVGRRKVAAAALACLIVLLNVERLRVGETAADAPKAVERPKAADALTVEFREPGGQLQRILDLFRNTAVGHPAGALAAWKTANQGKASLGKGTEALVSLLNPQMVGELQHLEGTRIAVGYQGEPGRNSWRMTIPRDDGTFKALSTALALTDGATLEPLQGAPVRRLGKEFSPLSTINGTRLLFGSDRKQLELALAGADRPLASAQAGLNFQLDPLGLANATSLNARRLKAALESTGTHSVFGRLHFEADRVELDWTAARIAEPSAILAISLDWLDGLPADNVAGAFATLVETDPESLKRLFEIADRIEKADPARADVVSSRIRINLLAAAVGIKPEVDIWPKLRGVSGCWSVDDLGAIEKVVVGLHAIDAKSAEVLASQTLPKLLSPKPGEKELIAGGLPIAVRQAGSTVWIGYGPDALDGAEPSVGSVLRPLFPGPAPKRLGAIWPGRLPVERRYGTALAKSLKASPPIIWRSDSDGVDVRGRLSWGSLRETVERWVNALPLVFPRDRPASQ